MINEDYSDGSDSSDEDYVPGGASVGDVPSEVESDGDSEDPLSDTDNTDASARIKQRRKTARKKTAKNGIKTAGVPAKEEGADEQPIKSVEQLEEEKKKHDDDLWASFKKDTGFKSRTTRETTTTSSTNGTDKTTAKAAENKAQDILKPKQSDMIKVTQIFEFAGEAVKVEKEVKADSAEARLSLPNLQNSSASASSSLGVRTPAPKRNSSGLGGIGSVLSQLNKKQKLSVLEKTKLDWNQYKQKEQIEDELESYKKGKDGYLEKQDFLQRADLRQFEIEKEVRAVERSKRMNNS